MCVCVCGGGVLRETTNWRLSTEERNFPNNKFELSVSIHGSNSFLDCRLVVMNHLDVSIK